MVAALSTNQVTWAITLVIGLVVACVVWALLEILRRAVLQVDEAVTAVWIMGKRLAQNTQTTYLLQTTHARGVDLLEELGHHGDHGGGHGYHGEPGHHGEHVAGEPGHQGEPGHAGGPAERSER